MGKKGWGGGWRVHVPSTEKEAKGGKGVPYWVRGRWHGVLGWVGTAVCFSVWANLGRGFADFEVGYEIG